MNKEIEGGFVEGYVGSSGWITVSKPRRFKTINLFKWAVDIFWSWKPISFEIKIRPRLYKVSGIIRIKTYEP